MIRKNKTSILAALICSVAIFAIHDWVNANDDLDKNIKVTICHIPPGNPDNAHSITISLKALEHHLAHGDVVGACVEVDTDESGGDDSGSAVFAP